MTGVRLVTLNTPMPVSPHYADTFALDGALCPVCCELAADAWERMTQGGIPVMEAAFVPDNIVFGLGGRNYMTSRVRLAVR